MMLGSLLAGLAFSNAGNALAHAVAYPIGGLVNSPHGEVTGLLMPYVMRYNVATSKDKMVKIAKIFNLVHDDKTTTELAYAAADAVLKLTGEIGLPTKLSQIGIKEANLEEIAEKSLPIERLIRNSPRVPRKDSLMELLKEAY